MAIGAIERRQGKWAESTANLEKAASLSPMDAWVLVIILPTIIVPTGIRNLRTNFSIARSQLRPIPSARVSEGELAVDWKGDLSVMERELAKMPPAVYPDGTRHVGRIS